MSTTYRNECTRHIILWWKNHVPNMICQCQSKQKLRVWHEAMFLKRNVNFTLRSKIEIILESWIYATRHLMVMQAGLRTHRQADGQTEWFLYTPHATNFVQRGGGQKWNKAVKHVQNRIVKLSKKGEDDLSYWTCVQSQLLYVAIKICSNQKSKKRSFDSFTFRRLMQREHISLP